MKNLTFLFVAGILLISLTSALELESNLERNVIIKEFSNPVTAKVYVTDATPGFYNFYTFSELSLEPRGIFQINNTQDFEETLIFTSRESLDVDGLYTFTYALNHRGVEIVESRETIKLLSIVDAISLKTEPLDIEDSQIRIYLKNKENIFLDDLNIIFSSILFENISSTISLEPFEELEIQIEVESDKLGKTKAGSYILKAIIDTPQGERIVEGTISLVETKGIVTANDESGFLIKTNTITKVNSGNVLENIEISINKNIFSRLFTSFNVEPTVVRREGFSVQYIWLKERLGPTEVYTVKARTNYILPILILIFAIILFVGLRRYTQTKIEVRKSVSPVKAKNGEFALKIRLNIRARKFVENVSVIDKIPAIVKLFNKFETIKPDKIDSENRRVHWNLGDLNEGEERAITYIVYSKVGVVGKFSLPEALVVFEKNGQIHEVESQKVYFMNEAVRD